MADRPIIAEPFRLEISRDIAAAPDRIFDAWLDEGGVGHWLFATPEGIMKRVTIDPRVGGRYHIAEQRKDGRVAHFGEYLEIDRPTRLSFTFATDQVETASIVSIDIERRGSASRVLLTHEMDAAWKAYEDRLREGWGGVLDGLASELHRTA